MTSWALMLYGKFIWSGKSCFIPFSLKSSCPRTGQTSSEAMVFNLGSWGLRGWFSIRESQEWTWEGCSCQVSLREQSSRTARIEDTAVRVCDVLFSCYCAALQNIQLISPVTEQHHYHVSILFCCCMLHIQLHLFACISRRHFVPK